MAAVLLLVNIYLFQFVSTQADGLTHVYVLDVGQGDAILIRTADSETVLVDGGPSDKILDHLGRLLPPNDSAIDLLVSTHPDADHVGGLVPVLQNYTVNKLWYSGATHDTQTYKKFLELVSSKQISSEVVGAGTSEKLVGATIDVLHPPAEIPVSSLATNDSSVVAHFRMDEFDLLLTADISDKIERQLLLSSKLSPVEVLKVPHHGSRYSSSPDLLQTTSPGVAVVSVGRDNTYNHPHPETLARYKDIDVPVYRTDLEGTIEIATDGTYYKVKTSRLLR